MNSMLLLLLLASVALVVTHVIPALPSTRRRLVAVIGEAGYQGVYSLVALLTIVAMVYAFNRSPLEIFWEPSAFVKRIAAVFMLLAFIFLVTGLMTRNPTIFGQESTLDDDIPARGIVRITRYPFLWATILWSTSHIAANGDMASIIFFGGFFGGFFGLAVLGSMGIDKKRAAKYGDQWRRFADTTSNIPFAAILSGRNKLILSEIGWVKPAISIAFYSGTIMAHLWLFGVTPY